MMNEKSEDKISRIMRDPKKIREVLQGAIKEALLKHKQAGNPVCSGKDGKVFWVQPEDILSDPNK